MSRFPVVEVFGPTFQGEGPWAGRMCDFIRFGGCDYRCSWCDSMHAVEPAQVRLADKLDEHELLARLADLGSPAGTVVLSGGNPAMLKLDGMVELLHAHDYQVSVETQGSVWRPWLELVDMLVVSPKPPSSGMATGKHVAQTSRFMEAAEASGVSRVMKIVAFDDDDLLWALRTAEQYPGWPLYLSAGTDSQGKEPLLDTASRYRWLLEALAQMARSARWQEIANRVVVLPQLHVVAWGHQLGV